MLCPYCEYKESKVLDSRHIDSSSIRRRRECERCKKRFTTYEKIEMIPVMVIKKDGRRESFDRDKIKFGLVRSCEKRPISVAKIDEIVDSVESEINKMFVDEIETSKIGLMLMDKLKEVDEVAYVRFASVYRQFKDLNTFVNELESIIHEKGENKDDEIENK
ncbi:transcriptional regulator NrdR [Peptostreptococcus equinus]|uniref:Transcriptional repressor NrdR n=1 Tax=Peptostreptococcus equinus TaxID=3003601 RepID=A0ABY7JU53_9FIRM|nr:transcriptional regulator NrdR [Peptostreptococcus sp. CBA3647]WAW15603.1 transcriptional regulator NrdR [Peptostreptococcus sp. CBA3647]